MDHHCHCPPVDHALPPCEQQDSSWSTAQHHCHPPCPPCPPPPCEQDDYFFWNNPAFPPAFQPTPSPRTSGAGASCTVRVEKAAATGDRAPLLESKQVHGAAASPAGPSATEALLVLLFWAAVAGLVYWCWFR